MTRFGRKNLFKQIFCTKITLVLLLVAIFYMAKATYERFEVERSVYERRAEVEEKHAELQERKAALEERVDYLKGESGIESEIRNHFDVAKEGEQVVIIVENEDTETDSNETVKSELAEPWYKFW